MSENDLTDEEKALLEQAEEGEKDGLAGNTQAPGIAKSDSDGPVSDNRMREPTSEPGELSPQEEGASKPARRSPRKQEASTEESAAPAQVTNEPAQYGEGVEGLPSQMSYEDPQDDK